MRAEALLDHHREIGVTVEWHRILLPALREHADSPSARAPASATARRTAVPPTRLSEPSEQALWQHVPPYGEVPTGRRQRLALSGDVAQPGNPE
ncbi:hypothetical protein [Nonomuraea helvata]|uniref:hypothetical protein n=1 Tax=Nonomuraea helvata TaxID=37484 RepID=UPI0031EDE5FF